MMNLRKLFTLFGMLLLSFEALSVGLYSIRVGDLTITHSDQIAPKGAVLGFGWKVFTPGYGEEICESVNPSSYTYTPSNSSRYAGMSVNHDSTNYPVFETNIDGVGYAMAVRQMGTSKWNPVVSGTGGVINTEPDTKMLNLEVKFAYVKTSEGSIDIPGTTVSLGETTVYCASTTGGWISSLGDIRLRGGGTAIDNRTCDVRTPTRQTVNLGTHSQSEINHLKVGDTFGATQQSMTIECPNKMTVYYAVTDNNNPENIGKDIILLENESEKPGFGVKMYEAGKSSALKLGGDKDLAAQYQYLFVKTGNTDEVATKAFDFKYVKTSQDVKAVDGNAQVTLTLMYK